MTEPLRYKACKSISYSRVLDEKKVGRGIIFGFWVVYFNNHAFPSCGGSIKRALYINTVLSLFLRSMPIVKIKIIILLFRLSA